ncbi:hypothetical protein GCM10008967_29580 [Bacillus carboniphilus]|uniref:HEAT repeat domain-containing protein n=1 Tax=Bacillus carboniphilus TaxID=86663 RepID=A0ABP3G6B8_9BACI
MDKKEYVIDLINRMNDTTRVFDPEFNGYVPVISKQAYNEAEQLADKECIEPLKNLIAVHSSNKAFDKDVRRKVYNILNKIATNTNEMDVFTFFEERLDYETDKYIVGDGLLEDIVRSEYVPALKRILPLVEHKDWQVRHEAIRLLGRYQKEEVEDTLLSLLKADSNPYDIEYTLGALGRIGSTKVLERIDPLLYHKKGEVRASAIAILKVVGGKTYMKVYEEGLNDRSPAVKLNALSAILKHGDEKQIPLLISRLKTILKRERKYEPGNLESSDVVKILKFLLHYKNEQVVELLEWIREKKWSMLFELEQEWLLKET